MAESKYDARVTRERLTIHKARYRHSPELIRCSLHFPTKCRTFLAHHRELKILAPYKKVTWQT